MSNYNKSKHAVLKRILQNYHRLAQFEIINVHRINNNNSLGENLILLKLEVDEALEKLSNHHKLLIHLAYIQDVSVQKICSMLAYKFRVDHYRKLEYALNSLAEHLGPNYI